jgi:hypothetical protein
MAVQEGWAVKAVQEGWAVKAVQEDEVVMEVTLPQPAAPPPSVWAMAAIPTRVVGQRT